MDSQAKEPRILVINASLDILNLFYDILDGQGYEVELSNYTFEGVGTVERLRPDLIILDFIREGQKEEWQLLQMLKMYEKTASIPIILCTAALLIFREQEDYFRSKNILLLLKPFVKDDLLRAVRQILSSPSPG
jgi:CheY-like chemotaxis protein